MSQTQAVVFSAAAENSADNKTDERAEAGGRLRQHLPEEPTPSENNIPLIHGEFDSLAEALDYAASGRTGYNFYDRRGRLYKVLPYRELRGQARALARKLIGTGVQRGSRMAIVANTHPDFIRFFFACQYAGIIPVPLPVVVQFNRARGYVSQLRRLLESSKASLAVATLDYLPLLKEAAEGVSLMMGLPEDYDDLPESSSTLEPLSGSELAYLQFTSGSTRFPKGVMVNQRAVMNNIQVISGPGLHLEPADRAVSWLPFYHDMGLVGLVLATVGSQLSVDFFSTADFIMRPGLWIRLMSENRGTISFSPPFGYELAAMRLRSTDLEKADLSSWRVAGVGAEMIRPELLSRFAERLQPCGFDPRAFLPCYGMAECSLAVSFSRVGTGMKVDRLDQERLLEENLVVQLEEDQQAAKVKEFVRCGRLLPGFEAEIRDSAGEPVPPGQCGTLYLRGPSIMKGYFNDPEATKEVLSEEGWLNTGDVAYFSGDELVITGRSKDLIIINGRNIWPQDLEYLAEGMEGVRMGDSCAFSLTDSQGREHAVLVVQVRNPDQEETKTLADRLKALILKEIGIDCHIQVVPRNTLVKTTSGKTSRHGTKKHCLELGLIDLP